MLRCKVYELEFLCYPKEARTSKFTESPIPECSASDTMGLRLPPGGLPAQVSTQSAVRHMPAELGGGGLLYGDTLGRLERANLNDSSGILGYSRVG